MNDAIKQQNRTTHVTVTSQVTLVRATRQYQLVA